MNLTSNKAERLALFLKRPNFDHFLSCTEGAPDSPMKSSHMKHRTP